ncbi:MAG TPA: PCRF domain-containing protein, partial [bacterium]|nr:PCRF domain-containing protein [bacterium]
MWDKLEEIERRYMELEESLAKPDVIANQELFQSLAKTYNELGDVVGIYRRYKQIDKEISDIKSLLDDPELGGMAEEELEKLEGEKEKLEEELRIKLLPKDYRDERNVIMEIRAGTGGEEAALFAGDLLRMYLRYVERKGWKA